MSEYSALFPVSTRLGRRAIYRPAEFVGSAPIEPNILTLTLPSVQEDSAYSQTLEVSGGLAPFFWAITSGSLPAGLSLNSSSGMITGTPPTPGLSQFTVSVQDSLGQEDSQPLSIDVTTSVPISGTLIFSADNETTNILSQWNGSGGGAAQEGWVGTTTATGGVTPRHGNRMAFHTVHPDRPAPWASTLCSSGVQRSGLGAAVQNNTDIYYGFSIWLPPGLQWQVDTLMTTLAEWHGDANGSPPMGQAPIHFGIHRITGQFYLDLHRTSNVGTFTPTFTEQMGAHITGEWVDVVIRTKWSSTSTGAIQCWINGVLKCNRTNIATWNTHPGESIYPVSSFYRQRDAVLHNASTRLNAATHYKDSTRIGTTREIVDPASYD